MGYTNRFIGLVARVFANGPVDRGSIPGDSYQRLKKWHLMPLHLTLNIIKYESRIKWSNPWTSSRNLFMALDLAV